LFQPNGKYLILFRVNGKAHGKTQKTTEKQTALYAVEQR